MSEQDGGGDWCGDLPRPQHKQKSAVPDVVAGDTASSKCPRGEAAGLEQRMLGHVHSGLRRRG